MLKVVTHNGVFQADDVLACAMMRILDPGCEIQRTRDKAAILAADVVLDVGGVYDPEHGRYDHHQPNRAGARPNGILYSAAGLLWFHRGSEIVAQILSQHSPTREAVWAVAERVDNALIGPICAQDNGQELHETPPVLGTHHGRTVSHILSSFNPTWLETANGNAEFVAALEVAKTVLTREAVRAFGAVFAKEEVEAAIRRSSGAILELDRFVPWAEHLGSDTTHLFCVYPDATGQWITKAVPSGEGSFQSKRLLPEAWAGLTEHDFYRVTGVPDAKFCHPGRFIAGASSKEGAIQLARLAILAT